MYLNVIPSHECALNHIRVPSKLMKILNLDYGDWLLFDTKQGCCSVMVTKSNIDDIIEYGDNRAFVSPHSPILESASSEVLIEPHKLTIGGDPEFFILNNRGRLIEASRIFPFDGAVGSDGHLGELRPDYALCPDQFVENIRRLILELKNRLPTGLIPVASSYLNHRCSGFHIHLGMPIELLSFAANDVDRFFKNLVATLDYLVALPAAALDPDDSRRLSFSYGKPGDYRLSMRTLEYRTPGGFHLKSPIYAKHLLSSAYKVVDKIVSETEKISGGWREMSNVTDFSYFRNVYNIPDKKYVHDILLTKNRNLMEKEASKAISILKTIAEEYSENIIEFRKQRNESLISEWLTHETKRQADFYKTRRPASISPWRG